ncbi:hypothetical protein D3C84_1083940 [compost metagenome]
MRMLAALLAELTQQILLIFRQVGWRHDDNLHVLVTLTEAAQMRNAFSFKTEIRVRLRTSGDFQLNLLCKRWDFDFIPKCCLHKC